MVASGCWIGLWCGLWVEALVDNNGFLATSKLYNELPILMILYILWLKYLGSIYEPALFPLISSLSCFGPSLIAGRWRPDSS